MQKKEPVLKWTFFEYEKYDRGVIWYLVAAVIVGLLLIYSVVAQDYLFGVLIALVIFIIFIRHTREPRKITCELFIDGIAVGGHFHDFPTIRHFAIVEIENDKHLLYIQRKVGFRNLMPIPIADHDHSHIREFLLNYLVEDSEHRHETLWDGMGRLFKI